MDDTYKPVTVNVNLGDLRRLCTLARESGEDMQAAARRECQGDHPSTVRRRDRDVAVAQYVIDLANYVARSSGVETANNPKENEE